MSRRKSREIDPDQVLLDSSNLPEFNQAQFEGRLEKPISRWALLATGAAFFLILGVFLAQAGNLQLVHGEEYLERSENNLLHPVPLFASRGAVLDRNGLPLVWNAPSGTSTDDSVPKREYAHVPGIAHVLGYVQYPSKDKNGYYYQNDFNGVDGVEQFFNERLNGENGSRLIEIDARGNLISESVVRPAIPGETIHLSIDSGVQSALYENIKGIASQYGFKGGAGIIMDVETGELIALTSYPEYSPQVMSDKSDQVAIKAALSDTALPFLDRAVGGLYTPGSIVKPFVAMGVLNEKIIDPSTIIYTKGQIEVPNPYDPEVTNIFRDWKNLGALDLRHAIAMSSDAYFYIVGGGYKDQKGLGIANIAKYLSMFGIGEAFPADSFVSGPRGVLSTPAWKQATFKEAWFLGNTYHSVIGQYGTQVTPAQMIRAVGAMANKGNLLVPTIVMDDTPVIDRTIDLPISYFNIVHEGMRLGSTQGTTAAFNVPYVQIAAKSGTAELGVSKANVNSWVMGFWPYEKPKYAFTVVLEHGSVHNLIGAVAVMKNQFEWMKTNATAYLNPGSTLTVEKILVE